MSTDAISPEGVGNLPDPSDAMYSVIISLGKKLKLFIFSFLDLSTV